MIYVAVGITIIVVSVIVFVWKRCRSSRQAEAIALANFDSDAQQPFVEGVQRSLSEEEAEFDELVAEYQKAREVASPDIAQGIVCQIIYLKNIFVFW